MYLLKLSASSAALDLAQPPPAPDASSTGWGNIHGHRPRQSLSTASSSQVNGGISLTPTQASTTTEVSNIGGRPASIRHSLEMKPIDMKYYENASEAPAANNHILATPPKLQSSFSANDIPTVKNVSGQAVMTGNTTTNHAAQQHLHNHNASIGRIPAGAVPNRHSRELSADNNMGARESIAGYPSIGSTLQANAAPFGPVSQAQAPASSAPTVTSPAPVSTYNNGFYGQSGYSTPNGANGANYGLPLLTMNMQGLSLNGGGNMYSPQNYTGYGAVYAPPAQAPRDSQARIIQNRRQLDYEGKMILALQYC